MKALSRLLLSLVSLVLGRLVVCALFFSSCAEPVPPSLELTPASQTLVSNQPLQLTVTRRFPGGAVEDVTSKVTYTIPPTSRRVATVNERGVVTAGTDPGTVIVKAFDSLSDATAFTTISVVASQIASIELSPSPAIVMTRGTTRQFTATARLTDGTTKDVTRDVLWSSTNEAAAVVGNTQFDKGSVSAVAAGDTTILATDAATRIQGRSIVFIAGETPVLTAIVVTPNPGVVAVNAAVQFGALGILSDGTTKDFTRTVTWTSSRPDIATVNNIGVVTGTLVGDTTITAQGPEPTTTVRGSAAAKVVP